MVRASDQDATATPPLRGVLGTSMWAKGLVQGPGLARRIRFSAWPGNTLGSPEELENVAVEKEA